MSYSYRADSQTRLVADALNNTTTTTNLTLGNGVGYAFPNDGVNYVICWSDTYASPDMDADYRIGQINSRTLNSIDVTWGKLGTKITAKGGTPYIALLDPDVDEVAARSEESESRAEDTMGAVVHGDDADMTRPTGFASITWIGEVAPANAITNDIWYDTSS